MLDIVFLPFKLLFFLLKLVFALVLFAILLAPPALAQPPMAPVVDFVAVTPAERVSPERVPPSTPVRLAFSCSVDELIMAPATQILVEFATGPLPPTTILLPSGANATAVMPMLPDPNDLSSVVRARISPVGRSRSGIRGSPTRRPASAARPAAGRSRP